METDWNRPNQYDVAECVFKLPLRVWRILTIAIWVLPPKSWTPALAHVPGRFAWLLHWRYQEGLHGSSVQEGSHSSSVGDRLLPGRFTQLETDLYQKGSHGSSVGDRLIPERFTRLLSHK